MYGGVNSEILYGDSCLLRPGRLRLYIQVVRLFHLEGETPLVLIILRWSDRTWAVTRSAVCHCHCSLTPNRTSASASKRRRKQTSLFMSSLSEDNATDLILPE